MNPTTDIKVCWSRSKADKSPTSDLDGYSMYRFSFNDGTNITDKAIQYTGLSHACSWQKVLFTTKSFMTNVEVWKLKGKDVVIIYAEPHNDIKSQLKD